METNFDGSEEHWEEVSPHGCSTGLFAFVLKFLLRNLVSLDSGAANGARSPPETPRSQLGDHLRHEFGRVGEVDQVEDEDRQEKYVKVSQKLTCVQWPSRAY